MLDRAENIRHFEVMNSLFSLLPSSLPSIQLGSPYHLYQNGTEIKIDSVQNDGSNDQICQCASRRECEIYSLRRSYRWYRETRCDKTEGTIHSTMIFTLDDCCADRSAGGDKQYFSIV